MKITNKHNLSLPLAVLLCTSDYDYDTRENAISATTIMKPLKSIVLSMQNQDIQREFDIIDMVPAVFGSAVHAFAEKGWNDKETVTKALTALGISPEIQSRVVVNPNPKKLKKDAIPIYIEKRSERKVNGWIVRGKFDACIDGKLSDHKTCSVWSTIFGSNDKDYTLQGSIYRWLNPEIVFANEISIEKNYTDWSSSKARSDSKYPQLRAESMNYPLMSNEATGSFIVSKLKQIDECLKLHQDEMPPCSEEELWSTPAEYKYFKKLEAKRATKIYHSIEEANARLNTEGCGTVKVFPGQIKRCAYCNVQPVCNQSKGYIADGRLKL